MAKKTKKAKKRAAPLKSEATRSRVATPQKRTLQIEKLGKVITWDVPSKPYADNENLRTAFIGGFEARVQHVNSSSDEGVPQRFTAGSKDQQAFEDGYHEAARQDGEHLKPLGLKGSSSPAKGRTR